MCAAFHRQIDSDQVGATNLLDHLPKYAHLDLDLGGKHLTAQIDFDQRAGGRSVHADLQGGGHHLQAQIDHDQRVGVDPDEYSIVGAEASLEQLFEVVGGGRAIPHDGNAGHVPDAVLYQIVGDDDDRFPEYTARDRNNLPETLGMQIVGVDDQVGSLWGAIKKATHIDKIASKTVGRKVSVRAPTPKQVVKSVGKSVAIAGAVASLAVPGLGIAGGAALAGAGAAISKGSSLLKGASKAAGTVKAGVRTARGVAQPVASAAHVAGVHVAADRLIAAAEKGGKGAKTAARVIQQTNQLAARGNADAKAAQQIVLNVAAQRRAALIPRGQAQPLTQKGAAALTAFAQAPKLTSVLADPPSSTGRKGWLISMEPTSYGRIDFSGGKTGRWVPV